MGVSSVPNIDSGEMSSKRRFLWQVVRNQRVGRRINGGHIVIRSKRPAAGGRILTMKKRARRVEGSRRPAAAFGIQRRVRTLKKLVPNGEAMGVDGLFRETADYILALEMRVKVMKIMMKVLTGCDE